MTSVLTKAFHMPGRQQDFSRMLLINDILSLSLDHRQHMDLGTTMCRNSEESTICKPRRKISEETNLVDTFILDFQTLELLSDKFYCLSQSILAIPVS